MFSLLRTTHVESAKSRAGGQVNSRFLVTLVISLLLTIFL